MIVLCYHLAYETSNNQVGIVIVSVRKENDAMKLYGYKDEGLPIEAIESSELAEITLVASPDELRKISAFLAAAANDMETMGSNYGHEHLADKQPGFAQSPHFVVFNLEQHKR